MSRAEERIARVKELDITDLMIGYGYPIHGGGREEQFSCDLHGDGMDRKPSGRLYPESNTVYCFTCDKTRDTIELVREKEGLDFWAAVRFLEKRGNLPTLPWSGDDYVRETASSRVARDLSVKETFEDDLRRLTKFIRRETNDRLIPMADILAFWEARDRLAWMFEQGMVREKQARLAATALRQRFLALVTGGR